MHDAITAAAAALPEIATAVAHFADGTTVTRHVIDYPATPPAEPGDEPGRPHTLTTFEIRDPAGGLVDATTRMTVTPEGAR